MAQQDSTWLDNNIDNLYKSKQVGHNDVESSLQYYREDLARWKTFYEKVAIKLDELNQVEIAKSKH